MVDEHNSKQFPQQGSIFPGGVFDSKLAAGISAITVLLALTYFIGWLGLSSYLFEFNATWLLKDLPPFKFLVFGGAPILLVFMFSILAVLLLSLGDWLVKAIKYIVVFGSQVVVLLMLANVVLILWPALLPLDFFAKVSTVIWALLVVASVVSSFFRSGLEADAWEKRWNYVAHGTVLIGLVFFPIVVGRSAALRDLDPLRSKLPTLTVRAESTTSKPMSLLMTTESRIYAVVLEPASATNVFIVPWDQVTAIRGQR